MGKTFSSNKDYNRALAKQPIQSISLSKLDVSNVQQQPLVGTLSIPYPVRISESTEKIPDTINQLPPIEEVTSPVNEYIQSPSLHSNINHYPEQQPIVVPRRAYSLRVPVSHRNQTMSNDPVIIRRSVVNLNKHRRTDDNQLATYASRPTIIERNGKQFVTEVKERMERRYVQIFDEATGQMRLFEVTDYIPTRTVTSVRNSPQRSFSTRSPFNQRPSSRGTLNSRPEPTATSTLVNFSDLNNRGNVARQFDLYHSGANVTFNDSNRSNTPPILTSKQSGSSSYTESQSRGYNSTPTTPRTVTNQYSPSSYQSEARSYRRHSPTPSNYSVTTTTNQSTDDDSDRESVDRVLTPTNFRTRSTRNDPPTTNGAYSGGSSSSDPDPFARGIQPGDHTYTQRPGVNNYSEPMTLKQGFASLGTSDYAPLAPSQGIAAFVFKDDVILAADVLDSYGLLTKYRNISRIHQVNEKPVRATGGDLSDADYIKEAIDSKVYVVIGSSCDGGEMAPLALYAWWLDSNQLNKDQAEQLMGRIMKQLFYRYCRAFACYRVCIVTNDGIEFKANEVQPAWSLAPILRNIE
ncbi:unnamed protein product [Adineta ricciae]|uniref:Uncharacterized protein n=1 Tax=Adineta ricciae TaxID=249248 RepID=A0A815QFV0_ADIRI|nr:unnamed protein product [Adineta ricciae]